MVVPPVVVWAVGIVGAAVVTRLIVKEWRRLNEELARAKAAPVAVKSNAAIPRLWRDPVTGVYRLYR